MSILRNAHVALSILSVKGLRLSNGRQRHRSRDQVRAGREQLGTGSEPATKQQAEVEPAGDQPLLLILR